MYFSLVRYYFILPNGKKTEAMLASAGRWIGATYGIYARGNGGSATCKYFKTIIK